MRRFPNKLHYSKQSQIDDLYQFVAVSMTYCYNRPMLPERSCGDWMSIRSISNGGLRCWTWIAQQRQLVVAVRGDLRLAALQRLTALFRQGFQTWRPNAASNFLISSANLKNFPKMPITSSTALS